MCRKGVGFGQFRKTRSLLRESVGVAFPHTWLGRHTLGNLPLAALGAAFQNNPD